MNSKNLRCFLLIVSWLIFSTNGFSQISVSGGTLASGTYSNLKTAIDSINIYPVTAPITIDVDAGFIDTLSSKIILLASGTNINTITIKKNGTGDNPKLISYVGSVSTTPLFSTSDGFLVLAGCDYVTIDGIDFIERSSNTTATTLMEFGIGLMKKNANDGCQYNTIKNCNITLNRLQTTNWAFGFNGSTGIVSLNALYNSNSLVTTTNIAGSNSYNKLENNSIQNCHTGIAFTGYNAPSPYLNNLNGLGDSDNQIGGESSLLGNNIFNYGGIGTLATAGIYLSNQWNLNCQNNNINNNNGNGINHTTTLRGIYLNGAIDATVNCSNNYINLKSASLSNVAVGIENTFGSNGTNNAINFIDNTIHVSALSSTNASCYGIHNNNSSNAKLFIKKNNIKLSSTATSGVGLYHYSAILVSGNISNLIAIDSNLIDTLRLVNNSSVQIRAINCVGGNNNTSTTISNNIFKSVQHTSTLGGSGEVSLIYHTGNPLNSIIKNNIATNLNFKTTGTIYLINNTYSALANRTKTIQGNVFENITRIASGSGGAMIGYNDLAASDSLSTIYIEENTIMNLNNGVSTQSVNGINLSTIDNFPKLIISNNTIKNLISQGGIIGMNINGIGGTAASPSLIDSNIISKINGESGNIIGIRIGAEVKNLYLSNNQIDSIYSSSNIECYAINLSGGVNSKTITINNNKIYEIKGTNTSSLSTGINVGSIDTLRIYNNLIGSILAPSSSSYNAVNGIKIGAANHVELSYNSIFINAVSASSHFGSSALYIASGVPKIISKNNIYVNTSNPGVDGGFTAAMRYLNNINASNYSTASNNNLYYAGIPSSNRLLYGESQNSTASNGQKSLLDFKYYMVNKESNSVSELPDFITTLGSSNNFLHINLASPNAIENGGIPITTINRDYDDTLRNSLTPDIGADEGNFTYQDKTPPYISFSPLGIACDSLDRILYVNITDQSGVPTSGIGRPILYWKIASEGLWKADTATYISNNTYQFSFGAGPLEVNDSVYYYLVAQDNATVPNIGAYPPTNADGYTPNPPSVIIPPTTLLSYKRSEQVLSGIQYVGTGQTFTSLTQMISAYQYYCIDGPVEFHLTDTLYNVNSILTMLDNPFVNSTNYIKIRPADSTIVKILADIDSSSIFNINGGDYITFDGSNNDSTDQSLTIVNNGNESSQIFRINGLADSTKNITIKNVKLKTGSSSSQSYGIHLGGGITESNGINIKNIYIHNNEFSLMSNAVFASGHSNNKIDSLNITNNKINLITAVKANGIKIRNTQNALISSNAIEVESSSSSIPSAINLEENVFNTKINNNDITKVKTTSAIGLGGRGISIAGENNDCHLSIFNNFISNISGSNNANPKFSSMAIGLGIKDTLSNYLCGGIDIFNNSINLFGNYSNNINCKTSALYIGNNTNNLNIRNNIFNNSTRNISAMGDDSKSFSIYSLSSAMSFDTIDYNNYFVEDTQGVLGYIDTVELNTLVAIENNFGQNENSVNVKPSFISNTNLHLDSLYNIFLDSVAIYLINEDFDDELRNINYPDIGADEFITLPCSNTIAAMLSVTLDSICSNTSYTVKTNVATGGNGVKYQWQKSSIGNGIGFVNVTDGTGWDALQYTTPVLTADTFHYRQRVVCIHTNDTSYSNELKLIVKNGATVNISPSDTISCISSPVLLVAEGSNIYSWSPSLGLNTVNNDSVYASPPLSTEYVVTATDQNGCINYDTAVVKINHIPIINYVTATYDTICIDSSTQLNIEYETDYLVSSVPFLLRDTTSFLSGPVGDDLLSNEIMLSFPFDFYHHTYHSIKISTNGFIHFGNSITGLHNSNSLLPDTLSPNNIIALCWADLITTTGDIKYGTNGVAPNRVFVIHFDSIQFKNDTGYVTGQIQLFETTNHIEVHLSQLSNNTVDKTLGTENHTGLLGTSPLKRNNYNFSANNPEAWKFTTSSATFQWMPATYLNNNTLQNPVASNVLNSIDYLIQINSNGCTSSEEGITINTISGPTFVSNPTSVIGCEGKSIVFQALAQGSNDLTYQWYKNGMPLLNNSNISGVNTSSLSIQQLSLADEGEYSLTATCCGTEIQSENATLLVSNNVVMNEENSGMHSLRNALECVADGDTVFFIPEVNFIPLRDSLFIDKDVTIYADTIGDVIIYIDFDLPSMTLSNYGLKTTVNKNIKIENLILEHRNNSISKPLLINEGNLEVKNVKLIGNIPPVLLNRLNGVLVNNGMVEIKIE